jgi:hypothetical protein
MVRDVVMVHHASLFRLWMNASLAHYHDADEPADAIHPRQP